jgi:hypothetical protein
MWPKIAVIQGAMTTNETYSGMSDDRLLTELRRLAAAERGVTAEFIRALEEVDTRRLYLGQGCSSLFAYCTRVLHLSEHAAYGRIEAARCARRFPLILERLEAGDITLTTITLLAPHLTADNHRAVLDEARHRSRRDTERIVARLRPQPDIPSSVRKLPKPAVAQAPPAEPSLLAAPAVPSKPDTAPRAAAVPPAPRRDTASARPAMRPLSPARYSLKMTIGQEAHDLLQRARALLRHAVPDGDPTIVFERALRALLRELERDRLGVVSRPRAPRQPSKRSRHVAAAVRREVWRRDAGRCAFVGVDGRRCDETAFLELHHLVPFADGGESTAGNLSLRCRLCRYRHNRHYAEWRIMPRRVRQRAKPCDFSRFGHHQIGIMPFMRGCSPEGQSLQRRQHAKVEDWDPRPPRCRSGGGLRRAGRTRLHTTVDWEFGPSPRPLEWVARGSPVGGERPESRDHRPFRA